MSSTLTNLLYHVVFSTKGRQPLIDDDLLIKLHAYIGGIIRANGGVALEVGGVTDHVHVLMKVKAAIALSNMIRQVKSVSSKWISEHFPTKTSFAWQSGYGAFTVSESSLNRVRIYIRNQEVHHRNQAFADEYLILLNRHHISYDPNYLLD